jgi:DNA adenine methylase
MHYVEPFAGSLAVLLERPHPCNRQYYSESCNDADGLLINAWRAIQWQPEATAEACSWPVSEVCKQARQAHLLAWAHSGMLDLLAGSPEWCDPQMAGWWLYSVCCQIGAFHGEGPWTADPVTGRLVKRGTGEPGVTRNRPHLGNNGEGVHRPQLREPGVTRNRPHLSDNGQGVHRPQVREPGVARNRPHLGNNGEGVHHAGLREPGVWRARPHLGNNGQGVHHAGLRAPGIGDEPEFHPLTMPELRRWFRWLSARLRHVRLVHGDWSRVCTTGARLTLSVRQREGVCGVFLDPPYSPNERTGTLYRVDGHLHDAVQTWCLATQADPRTRIVLSGYAGEYPALEAAGWTVHEWYVPGFLRGGYGNIDGTSQQHRERLWSSPQCVRQEERQMGLFARKE